MDRAGRNKTLMSSANGLRLNCVNGGEINCRRVQSSSDWRVISFFCPMQCYIWHVRYVLRTVWDMAVELQWWHSSCWHFLAHGNHFLPTVTLFGSPREAKDPRWIVFCSALLLFYPSTDPFFYFFSFSSPCLFYCHRVVCSVSSSLSLSLLRGTSPSPPPVSVLPIVSPVLQTGPHGIVLLQS